MRVRESRSLPVGQAFLPVSFNSPAAAAGLPTVDTLGPRGGELHSPREYLLLDSLTERAKLAALLLMKLAAGTA